LEAYSLFEVNQYIRRVIALNFEEPVWVACEINQISQTRGNTYLELIEKNEDSDEIVARSSATLWYRQHAFVRRKLGKQADEVLKAGMRVKLKCNVEFSERYGLSLNIIDIDPAYTYGQHELQRQQIIERLTSEGLLDKNRTTSVPVAFKKLAVISSETAAGFKDFLNELTYNNYGYTFEVDIFQAAMQGQKTESEVSTALEEMDHDYYDAVVIVRGGGSKLDLSAFDNYKIAAAIARCPIPVITGIGHEIDQSICDIVSHTSLKTPTAAAGFIIEHNLDFESQLDYMLAEIVDQVHSYLGEIKHKLNHYQNTISNQPRRMIGEKRLVLNNLFDKALALAQNRLSHCHSRLESLEKLATSLQPDNILKRGFTMVSAESKYITRRSGLKEDQSDITITFYDGDITIKRKN